MLHQTLCKFTNLAILSTQIKWTSSVCAPQNIGAIAAGTCCAAALLRCGYRGLAELTGYQPYPRRWKAMSVTEDSDQTFGLSTTTSGAPSHKLLSSPGSMQSRNPAPPVIMEADVPIDSSSSEGQGRRSGRSKRAARQSRSRGRQQSTSQSSKQQIDEPPAPPKNLRVNKKYKNDERLL